MNLVHLQVGDKMVVVNSDEEELETCVHAAHNELTYLLDKQRATVFADHR